MWEMQIKSPSRFLSWEGQKSEHQENQQQMLVGIQEKENPHSLLVGLQLISLWKSV